MEVMPLRRRRLGMPITEDDDDEVGEDGEDDGSDGDAAGQKPMDCIILLLVTFS